MLLLCAGKIQLVILWKNDNDSSGFSVVIFLGELATGGGTKYSGRISLAVLVMTGNPIKRTRKVNERQIWKWKYFIWHYGHVFNIQKKTITKLSHNQ